MKIIYVSTTAFSDNQLPLIKTLRESHDVLYLVMIPVRNSNYTASEIKDFCRKHEIPCICIPLKYRFRDPRIISQYLDVINNIRRSSPDITLFVNFDQLYINLLMTLCPAENTLIAMHDVENHSDTSFNLLKVLAKKVLFSRFKHFLTYSQHQRDALRKMYAGKNVTSIPLSPIGYGSVPTNNRAGTRKFLFFGNILSYKGLDILLKAARNLETMGTAPELIIAGRCDVWESEYQGLLSTGNAPECHIRYIGNEEIPTFFAKADFLVLPYRDTTQSGPLMIAYHYNVPVITSDATGFSEFARDGVTGLSFNLQDEGSLERVLLRAMYMQDEEYDSLKQNQQLFVDRHFSERTIKKSYLELFNAMKPMAEAIREPELFI